MHLIRVLSTPHHGGDGQAQEGKMTATQTLWARQALTGGGWRADVEIRIGADGCICSVQEDRRPSGTCFDVLLPAPANLHSHAFQRALAGLAERRSSGRRDTFWSWRQVMYRFLDRLTPDDIEAITAQAQMEMLEAGFAAVAEFHYLHHQPGGRPYDHRAETSRRIFAATARTGIGLTMLPVLYQQGGVDGRALNRHQLRFGCDMEAYVTLWQQAWTGLEYLPGDARLGVAPHSLRAVTPVALAAARALAPGQPFHLHLAEQAGEVDEIRDAWQARPVEWLLDNMDVDDTCCLVHCTWMQPGETKALARSGAVAGLCPQTESNLGDGIFDGRRYVAAGGAYGIGTDSNIRISLAGELRTLEYSQRLRHKGRAILAQGHDSTGKAIFSAAGHGGARAMGRNSGVITTGKLADILALTCDHVNLEARHGDALLDTWIFAGPENAVSDVWAAGRHVVRNGRHHLRDDIEKAYRKVIRRLGEEL